jgi:chemotaxis protein MotA
MVSVSKNLLGIACMITSLYLALTTTGMPSFGGVVHMPSIYMVFGILCGIALLVMDAVDIKRFIRFTFSLSSDKNLRQMQSSEKSFEMFAEVYAKDGGDALRKLIIEKKMPRIWNIVATKLAINVPIADIKDILDFQIQRVMVRLDQDITTLKQLATLAPGIGMFGTVLGLIHMLTSLQEFDKLGANMSLALITTLYGVFIGNILLVPIIRSVEKRKLYYLKNHSNLIYWLDHVEQKKPAFYMKTRLRDLDVKTI